MTQENTAPVESKPRKKTFKRILLWTLGILLVLIIVLPLILINYLSPLVKGAVEKFGSQAIGCPVTVEKIDISLLGGSVDIVDFKVGAPQGFKAEPISVHEVFVKVDLGSLLSDTIIVDEIRIDAPQVAYEVGWGKTNVGAILDALQGDAPKEEKKPEVKQEEKAEESGAGKKVCIRK
ncbi:MAG: AsmA family protein, partial [Victivallales bacterium]|nr:AsmA family protein [Victivallales bacterium]